MEHGIATGIYYPLPLHLTEPFKSGGDGIGSFPIAEEASQETLAIPLYPELSDAQLDTVINALKGSLRR